LARQRCLGGEVTEGHLFESEELNMVKYIGQLVAALAISLAVVPSFAQKGDEGRKEGETCGGVQNMKCRAGLECSRNEKRPDSVGVCRKPASHPE
jgi:hypothetical protein